MVFLEFRLKFKKCWRYLWISSHTHWAFLTGFPMSSNSPMPCEKYCIVRKPLQQLHWKLFDQRVLVGWRSKKSVLKKRSSNLMSIQCILVRIYSMHSIQSSCLSTAGSLLLTWFWHIFLQYIWLILWAFYQVNGSFPYYTRDVLRFPGFILWNNCVIGSQ